MTNHLKFIVVTVFTLLLALYVNHHNASDTEVQQTQSASQVATQASAIIQDKAQIPAVALQKSTDNSDVTAPSQSCITQAQINKSPILAEVEQWRFDTFGMGKIENENYMNEADLLDQANSGNIYAMFLLGYNYLFYSRTDTFHSPLVRPKTLKKLKHKSRPLDRAVNDKAYFWFEQAALNGIVGGFEGLRFALFDEIHRLENLQPLDEEKLNLLRLKLIAYEALQGWVVKEFAQYKKFQPPKGLIAQEQALFDEVFGELKQKWQKDRQALGFDYRFSINVPAAFHALEAMEARRCK